MTQLPLNLALECTYAREDFFRGASNEHAFQAIIESQECWQDVGQILVGPSGSGKTHLARVWQSLTEAVFLDLSRCFDEAQQHIPSTPQKKPAFILDDFPGKASEQDIFHLYNLVKEQGGTLLILSRLRPREWPFCLPDVTSRLFSLPVHTLENPDEALLAAVLRKRFSDFQIVVPEAIISYVLQRIERSFKAAQDFAVRLNGETLSQKKNVTLKIARACLEASCA